MREAVYHYNQQILKIIGYSTFIGIPVLFILLNASFYIMGLDLGGQENILLLFSNIMMFVLLSRPLHYLYDRCEQDEEVSLKEIIVSFFNSFGPIIFMTLIVMTCIYIGIALFIVPGIILFPFVFLFPFMYESKFTFKQWIRKTVAFHNRHVIAIWTQILLWGCFLYLLWAGVLYLVTFFEMTPIVFAILRIIFCLLVYPYVVFGISYKIIELSREEIV